MLIPLRTDGPGRHRPIATAGIIAVNVAVMVWTHFASGEDVWALALHYGEWKPWQWVTRAFLHAGWLHLVGNMVFLWTFGLIAEGRLGWLRFLGLYGAIAVASGAVEQTLLLGADGASLGASGVLFGLIAVAMVWAPENQVECIFIFWIQARYVDLSVRDLGFMYLAFEMLWVVFGGFTMGSAVLHLLGFATGLPIAIAMLRRGWVDCEGWDWYSRRDYHAKPIRAERPAAGTHAAATVPTKRPAPAAPSPARFATLLREGDLEGALRLHAACTAPERAALPAADRERLLDALVAADRAADARPLAQGLLADDPSHVRAGLLEAGCLVRERRLSEADRVLAAIASRLEDDAQRNAHAELVAHAATLRRAGALEFGD